MFAIQSRNETLVFDRTVLMGILNVTPDSFSDGGRYNQMDNALHHCENLISDGADIIDIGGCSTRPNNAIATEQEEMERVVPILKAIRTAFPKVLISIDTFRKNVAETCTEVNGTFTVGTEPVMVVLSGRLIVHSLNSGKY